MDAFEELVADLLRYHGYWTHVGYKVNLSPAQKVELGNPSLPRPEIDILAYQGASNTLAWVECKSYLDSPGVSVKAIQNLPNRYRVFTDDHFRELVSKELTAQTSAQKLTQALPTLEYWLVAGHVATDADRQALHRRFVTNGWVFRDETWIVEQLGRLAKAGYENNTAIMVAKLLKDFIVTSRGADSTPGQTGKNKRRPIGATAR